MFIFIANQIWDDIHSGKVEEDSALLLRFLIISFADLKKWSFHYWLAFPALVLDPPATLVDLKPASQCFSPEQVPYLWIFYIYWITELNLFMLIFFFCV